MTSEGLGVEGDSADMCAGKFPLVSMGGPSGGSRARRPGLSWIEAKSLLFQVVAEDIWLVVAEYIWFKKLAIGLVSPPLLPSSPAREPG